MSSALDQTRWGYYLYKVAGTLAPLLPPRLGYWLFGQFGLLAARSGEGYRAVWDNVSHVLGWDISEERRARVVREAFSSQAKNYFDLFRLTSLSDAEIQHLVTLHGLEHLDAALALGKGVIVVSIHFGNLDLVAQVFALRKYPVVTVAEHLRPEALYRYVSSLRASRGLRLIPADSFLRPVFRALRRNEIVGLAADRDVTESGVVVDFFGAPAKLPDGYAQLALRTGAALVPCFALRQPNNAFAAYVEPAVPVEATGNFAEDVKVTMGRVLRVMERYIEAHPGQWVMFRPIWRSVDERVGAE